jgi:hypothetical protein
MRVKLSSAGQGSMLPGAFRELPPGHAAYFDRMRKHHIIAVGAAIPLVGEFQRLGFPFIVGGP